MKESFITFSDALEWSGAQHVLGRKASPLEAVSTDSRTLKAGDLFVALKGPHFDGNDYVGEVVSKGAAAILTSRELSPVVLDEYRRKGVGVGYVEDGLRAIQSIAKGYRKQFSIPIVAITGSCGKTTTKEMAAAFLEDLGSVLKNEGTFNNHLGVPLTLLRLRPQHKVCCLELGTSAPGEISSLAEMAAPTMGVLLNIGHAHLKMLKSLEGVLEEKWTLIQQLNGGLGIVNADDPMLKQKAKTFTGPLLSYGIFNGGQLQASKIEFLRNQSMRFALIFEGEELGMVRLPLVGLHNIYNMLAAMCIGHALGVSWTSMVEKASGLKVPFMRWEMVKLNGMLVINDAYNANPQSMASSLETFRALRIDGKKIFVCGDMLDLGSEEQSLHQALAENVMKSEVHSMITVGSLAGLMARTVMEKGFPKSNVHICENHEQALARLLEMISVTDAVLVKGSRAMGMEKIVHGFIEHFKKEYQPIPVHS